MGTGYVGILHQRLGLAVAEVDQHGLLVTLDE